MSQDVSKSQAAAAAKPVSATPAAPQAAATKPAAVAAAKPVAATAKALPVAAAQPSTATSIPSGTTTATASLDLAAEPAESTEGQAEGEAGGSGFHIPRSYIYLGTATMSSLLVHMSVLIVMGLWVLPMVDKTVKQEIVSSVEERPQEVIDQKLDEEIKPSKDLALVSTAVSANAGAMGAAANTLAQPQMAVQPTNSEAPTAVKVDVGEVNVFKANGNVLSTELPEGTLGEAQAVSDSYQEAMDRVTQEILNRLAKGKVLVIWMFDRSGSMKDDRDEIRERVDRVYAELGIAATAKGDSLFTSVCSYGKEWGTHTKQPTADLEKIRAAIDEVPEDESGVENMCQAIEYAITSHRQFAGQRQTVLICVTDESGDPITNVQYLESTIALAKSSRCPLYFLGREAVFGYPYARMRWEDPATGVPFWLEIERGPETPFPEQLQIDGLHRRWDAHGSGFGPYEQTRMARQTGGVFFQLPSPEANLAGRDNRKYALEAMRPYLPDLSSRADYAAERDNSDLRRLIWKIILDLNPYDKKNQQPGSRVEVRHHYAIKHPDFVKEAKEEMLNCQRLITYMNEAEGALLKARELRDVEASPRWRANYDIIVAQLMLYQVRLWQLGLYLDAFSQNPLPIKNVHGPKRPTMRWELFTRKQLIEDPKFESQKARLEQATEILKQVMVEHKGTPYEARAQWELNRGVGVELREDWWDVNIARGIKVPKL